MEYIWQYYFLIILIFLQGLFFPLFRKNGMRSFSILCFLELFFIAGFRAWHIGTDTPNYIQAFILSINYPELMKTHMETGYLLFNRFLILFTTNPQILLISTSCFFMFVWLRTLYKYSTSFLFSTVLFVILEFSTTLTMIRQEIAICIVLLSLPFIIKRQFLPFIITCCLAACFHTSAVLAISLYFIYPLPIKLRYFYLIVFVSIISFFFLSPIIDQIIELTGHYGGYKERISSSEGIKTAIVYKTLFQFTITCFCVTSYYLFYSQVQTIKSSLKVSFLLWCSVLAFCAQFISIRGAGLDRVVLYFSSFNLVSIPLFVRCYPKQFRLLITITLVAVFILYRTIIFIYRPEWNAVLPFEFCF